MERSSVYQNIPKNTYSDSVSDFLSAFTFTINAFGHQSNNPRAICNNRITGDFELIFVKGGTSTITIAHRQYTCTAGDAILIPPFALHKIETLSDDPHDNYWIHFEVYPLFLHEAFIKSICPNGNKKVLIKGFGKVIEIYADIEQEMMERQPGSMAYCIALFSQIILLLLRERLGGAAALSNPGTEYKTETGIIINALTYIQNNIQVLIGIADLCGNLNISPSYLFKAFAKVLHGSPNYFIQMFKMKRAEQLMKSTNLSIKEISETLAYSSPYYFSSVFKKFYLMSPRDYRKNIR